MKDHHPDNRKQQIFGTSDERIIIQTIENNYTKKRIIIDNIHYAVINEKIDESLLTKMDIIMLASVNGADNCKNFFIFFSLFVKYLGSGFHDRLVIKGRK